MKKLISYLFTLTLIFTIGCNNENGGTGTITDPFGGGQVGGGGGTVTLNINFQSDQQGGGTFSVTPNMSVKFTKLTVSVTAEQYSESFQFDGTTVVNANTSVEFLEYPVNSGITTGQQWTFQFEGTTANNNQTFNVTSNYTIP